jgi:predicted enzyme related to lactoylglutathione lyase
VTDIDILFAGIPVGDLESAAGWYERLLGRPADVIVNDDEVMWRIADKAWMYVVRDETRAGQAIAALCVRDLDAAMQEVAGRGLTAGSVEVVGDAGRKVAFTDADGNTISLIEVRGR